MHFEAFQSEFEALLGPELQLWSARNNSPSESALDALQHRLGRVLPPDFRLFLREYGAVLLEVREEHWPRARLGQSGPFWLFQYGFVVFGSAPDIPDHLDIEFAYRDCLSSFRGAVPFPFLPVYREICSGFRTGFGAANSLFEIADDNPSEPHPVEGNLFEFLLMQTRALIARHQRFKELRTRPKGSGRG